MTNGFKLFQASRPKNAPAPMPLERASIDGVEVVEVFGVPPQHVFKEHRVTLRGEPLDHLTILDTAPRRAL